MNIKSVRCVIRGNLEVVEQGLRLISSLTDEQYTSVAPPVKSNIAEHIRHILDMYFSVIQREGDTIDYDARRRGHPRRKPPGMRHPRPPPSFR